MSPTDQVLEDLQEDPVLIGETAKVHRMLQLLDLDAMFASAPNPILLNKIDYSTPNYAEILRNYVYSRGSELDLVASCECEHLSSNHYLGLRCAQCGTEVKHRYGTLENLVHSTWIGVPERIPGIIHPRFYRVLSKWLSGEKAVNNIIDIICNPMLPVPVELEGIITGRGFKYFYDNFDYLMEFFLRSFKKTSKKKSTPYIERFIMKYRHVAFCTKLPVLSSLLHPMTSDSSEKTQRYVDKSSPQVMEAAIDLANLEFSPQRNRPSHIYDQVTFKAYKAYMEYLRDIARNRLGKKKSLIRHHLYGTRYHFSFRAVIVPLVGFHRCDELHLPWKVGVNLLKEHIIGKLTNKYGYNMSQAIRMQKCALMVYNQTIHQVINELIAESPRGRGIACLWDRPPSLQRGSCQLQFFTRVKTDINDNSAHMSVLVLSDANAIERSNQLSLV